MDLRKPDKNRIKAVMSGKLPDRVPNFEVLVENPTFSYIMERNMPTNTLANIAPEDYIEFVNKTGQDVVGMCFYSNPFFYENRDGSIKQLDYRIKSREDLKILLKPDINRLNSLFDRLDDYEKAIKGTDVGLFALLGDFFTLTYNSIFGFESFMYLIYDDISLIEEVLETASDYYVEIVKRIVKKDLTFLYIGDDLAFKSATLIAPDILRKIWVPRMKRIFEPALKRNIPILFHSDGNIEEIIPDLINMGINALNPIEPYGMDLKTIKNKFGRNIALVGNLDVGGSLSTGTPEDVRRDTKQLIDTAGKDGGLVVASSHSIMPNVKPENFMAMIDTAQTYGVYN
jgi:uroporphyrinogen decarboxylase